MALELIGAFKADAERRFGDDAAMGVVFRLDGDDRVLSHAEFMARPDAEFGAQSLFPDGSAAAICTNYAVQVCRAYPGRTEIWGFASKDNQKSAIAQSCCADGHDFAVVDHRFIVDGWLRLEGLSQQIVFDMQDSADAVEAARLYGEKSAWTRLIDVERDIAPTLGGERSTV